MTPALGKRIPRNEDARLLTGRALFVDDVQRPGMVHAAFLRSDHAHARIRAIHASAARRRPGVIAVYTADDLGDYWQHGPLLVPPPPVPGAIFHACTQVPLARDKVRHVGEPLAMVVAESRYIAEDALADIVVDLEPLPAVVDLERALSPEAPRLHEHLESLPFLGRCNYPKNSTFIVSRFDPLAQALQVRATFWILFLFFYYYPLSLHLLFAK